MFAKSTSHRFSKPSEAVVFGTIIGFLKGGAVLVAGVVSRSRFRLSSYMSQPVQFLSFLGFQGEWGVSIEPKG